MPRNKLVVLSGAGISAESGIQTFRGAGGLWEGHRVEDVASPEGWAANQELVLDFYNQRRRQLLQCQPNEGHKVLAALEQHFEVTIITQNVDDLHERGGSSDVIHLHGELLKARSTKDHNLVYDWHKDILIGDVCEKGSQLRPHIVWFGEAVPMIEQSIPFVRSADIFLIVGTSLLVYPAASLVYYTSNICNKFLVDPSDVEIQGIPNLTIIQSTAAKGLPQLAKKLIEEYSV
jgi:NAD-dependent deacetylase